VPLTARNSGGGRFQPDNCQLNPAIKKLNENANLDTAIALVHRSDGSVVMCFSLTLLLPLAVQVKVVAGGGFEPPTFRL
jgi:hypothetical protein